MKHLNLLGLKVRDKVTGCRGVVTSVCFDLYGCVQAALQPEAKDGKLPDSTWFDEKRLIVESDRPVMERPTFELIAGPAEHPKFRSLPAR